MTKPIPLLILCSILILPCANATVLGADWTEATSVAGWGRLLSHSTVSYDGKLWVLGGYDALSVPLDDVWSSTDGTNWTLVNSAAPWGTRGGHTSVVYNGKMWVIGGTHTVVNRLNDVWSSTDGVTWVQATSNASWAARDEHTSVVFDNKIWVIGGAEGSNSDLQNDVWSSSDGISWTEVNSAAPWSQRYQHTSVVHNGRIWVMGGFTLTPGATPLNDVWSSSDGVNWNEETTNAAWSTRGGHTSVVSDSRIWVLGGTRLGGYLNDVWFSTDGIAWTQAVANASWPARYHHTSVVYDNRFWVLGGINGSGALSDSWYSFATPSSILVAVDIKPANCPNLLNCGGRGVIPVAILGSDDLDVLDIDSASVRLVGVAPTRSSLEDVATPFLPITGRVDARDCTTEGPDGLLDLTLKFDKEELLAAIEAELGQPVEDGDVLTLMLEGELTGLQPIIGEDVVIIRCRRK